MILRTIAASTLMLMGSVALAAPSVSGNTISWPDDGWYQVLDEQTYSEVCGGTRSCEVEPGSYSVINHNTGMRWNNITVDQPGSSLTLVDFDITVPVIQSSQLQLRLIGGYKDFLASWAYDEQWSGAEEFQTNTEHTVTVSFSDQFGGVELGQAKVSFATGAKPTQSVKITDSQFDTDRFDYDNDGVSNIDEVIAGTDPFVDTEQLEVREPLEQGVPRIAFLSGDFESKIPTQRPYSESSEVITPWEFPDWGTLYNTKRTTIEINEFGTGTYSDYSDVQHTPADATTVTYTGTRTNTEASIIVEGNYERFQSGSVVSTKWDFSLETQINDDLTRTQDGVLYYYDDSHSFDIINATYSLSGSAIEESSDCEATAGTITYSTGRSQSGETIITKGPKDQYWKITVTDRDDKIVDKYQVSAINQTFHCQFADLM